MRSHRFVNSPLHLIIQLVAKESRAEENNRGIRCFFVLFIDKRYIYLRSFTLSFSSSSCCGLSILILASNIYKIIEAKSNEIDMNTKLIVE